MDEQLKDKRMATIIWLLLFFATLSTIIEETWAFPWLGVMVLILFGLGIYFMPPKGIKSAINSINPTLDKVVFDWYIPSILRYWKVVLMVMILSTVVLIQSI